MEEQFIDIYNIQEQHRRTVDRFSRDDSISQHNRDLVLKFLRDASLGKTVVSRAKKRIGPARLMGYIYQLYPLLLFTGKDLDQLQQEDMERFIEALESNALRKRLPNSRFGAVGSEGQVLSERVKVDVKVTVRKFYKWLLGQNKVYPPIVEWIDTFHEPREVRALTEVEVQRLIDHCKSVKQRALVQTLFDGGFRIGELLNVRLRHVRLHRFADTHPPQECFLIRVPFSKTLRRTVALPMPDSVRWLKHWLKVHPAKPVIEPDGTPGIGSAPAPGMGSEGSEYSGGSGGGGGASGGSVQLFPMSADAVRLALRRAGREALGKRVYPHLLRHTSATYWSNRLGYFKFCKRFGWSMTSNMPQRYIDREGVDELEVAQTYHRMQATTSSSSCGT